MPLYLSVPLPGPFRYATRIGGRHTNRFGSIWYWLLGLWAVEAAFWGVVVLCWFVWALIQHVRAQKKAPAPARWGIQETRGPGGCRSSPSGGSRRRVGGRLR